MTNPSDTNYTDNLFSIIYIDFFKQYFYMKQFKNKHKNNKNNTLHIIFNPDNENKK